AAAGHPERLCLSERLKASTPKSFIADLLGRLRWRYEEDDSRVVGSRARLFRETVDLLNTCTTKDHMPVIIIDETDNIIHYRHEEIIGMLRDIADNTIASVVLVGMQDLREKVMRLNTHYYNRFIYFCEFKPLTNEDCRSMCAGLADISIASDLANYTNAKDQARGDARKIVKAIRLYEDIAKILDVKELDLKSFLKATGKK
ncbi:MAG TPA: AAA family ATPase, partial [Candidatus Syntrophosphaera sp.]|nr:AAA family ATPase [Candidatus Syntrophosphaera sp.]